MSDRIATRYANGDVTRGGFSRSLFSFLRVSRVSHRGRRRGYLRARVETVLHKAVNGFQRGNVILPAPIQVPTRA
jgi:hypothetical protein